MNDKKYQKLSKFDEKINLILILITEIYINLYLITIGLFSFVNYLIEFQGKLRYASKSKTI